MLFIASRLPHAQRAVIRQPCALGANASPACLHGSWVAEMSQIKRNFNFLKGETRLALVHGLALNQRP
jgi:hypothetical protein